MDRSKLLQCLEGLIVTAAGVLFAGLALGIRDNPVPVEGAINVIVQAKFFPLALSALIVLQGAGLTVALWRGSEKTAADGLSSMRTWAVVLLSAAYFVSISLAGFAIPTVIYLGALLFLVNHGREPVRLLLLTALYSGIALLVVPGVLRLQLM